MEKLMTEYLATCDQCSATEMVRAYKIGEAREVLSSPDRHPLLQWKFWEGNNDRCGECIEKGEREIADKIGKIFAEGR